MHHRHSSTATQGRRRDPGIKIWLSALLVSTAFFATAPITSLAANSDGMHDAICNGDLNAVKRLLARGASVNKKMKNGEYPLELAAYCYGGKPRIADYLIKRGADVNKHSKSYNVLMNALGKAKADPNDAMRKIVIKLLDRGAKIRYQDPTQGRTPLMLAASNGDKQIVDRMLRAGASTKRRTKEDWCVSNRRDIQCTAADYARLGGHSLLALHIEGDRAGQTAYKRGLHHAAKTGNVRQIQRLIAAGTDLNSQEKLSKLTPLHYATMGGHTTTVRVLLKAGAQPNVRNYVGTTPLRNAIVQYEKETARLLIDHGAKVTNAQLQGCGGGMTELDWAISRNQADLIRYMIESGAVDPQNPGKAFQSFYGRHASDVDHVKLLLQKGARPTQADIDVLRLIDSRNSWLAELGHNAKIIVLLEKALKEPPQVIKPVVTIDDEDDLPEIPAELLEIRLRSSAPPVPTVKSRSLRAAGQQKRREFREQLAPELREFDTRFRDAEGRLDPRGF